MPATEARRSVPSTWFTDLVAANQAHLWRYLRYLGCDATLAEDLAQEVFLQVWRRPFEDRGPAAATAYLLRVARSRFIDQVRRRRVLPAFEDLDRADAAWRDAAREDQGAAWREALRTCLGRLTARARQVLTLFYGGACRREEVAERVGMTPDGVKTTLRRARAALRACIEGAVRT